MNENSVFVVVDGKAKPGQREGIFRAFERLLAPKAQSNPRQTLVAWCEHSSDPDRFQVIERYDSLEALHLNSTLPEFGQYMQDVQPLLAGQPDFSISTPRWQKSAGARDAK